MIGVAVRKARVAHLDVVAVREEHVGRGEVARLICAAGEVEFEDKLWDPAFDETGGWRQA